MFQIRKRDGTLEDFSTEKLTSAIEQALVASKQRDAQRQAPKIAADVAQIITRHFLPPLIATTQDIEDVLFEVFLKRKLKNVVAVWQNYVQKQKVKAFKTFNGIRNDVGLSENAMKVLIKRYLLKNDEGAVVESPERLFRRVAKAVAKADKVYDKQAKLWKTEDEFFTILAKREFLPNSPTLMNAGAKKALLSACFVIPIEDDLDRIFNAMRMQARIQQLGGGTGFNFSNIRPAGDRVKTTKGVASGPLSFMDLFDKTTDVIKQGGKRRGANMGILNATHPDIINFITSKLNNKILQNFNISVAVTDKFMKALAEGGEYDLIDPVTQKPLRKLSAQKVWDLIANIAWQKGDPGIIFIDEINKHNPTPKLGMIESTNPCGEQPLLPNESCNLGSIDVSKFVSKKRVEWERLKRTIQTAVHFLDNVIDAQYYHFEQIEQITKANRKIGLGVMGWAEMLIKLGIPYNSKKALEFAEKFMKFFMQESHKVSQDLGKKRGNFENFEKSVWAKKVKHLRNATVTTIAPTGSISIIADATSGIEPLFAVSFVRNVLDGTQLLEVNHTFEAIAKERGFWSKALMMRIASKGSVQDMKDVPKDVQRLFVTALDMLPDWHVKMQAVFQKFVDNGVSKTINLPENARVEDITKALLLAHKLECKGITVYRYGSKKNQVLTIGKRVDEKTIASHDYAGDCPSMMPC